MREDNAAVHPVERALAELRRGRFVALVGRRGGAEQGHLAIAAEHVTAEAVNFMATHARGIVCVALTPERSNELALDPIPTTDETVYAGSVQISIEAREGVTTGISAADRARTIRVAIDPRSRADDLVRPGHVVALRARAGGVLERAGRAEAIVDLARLAELAPAGAVCEILDGAGHLATLPELERFCRRHDLRTVALEELVSYRLERERLVERGASVRLPTDLGEFTAVAYRETLTGDLHVALVHGDVGAGVNALVSVHRECVIGDVFGSLLCECRRELQAALQRLATEESGLLVYLTRRRHGLDDLVAGHAGDTEEVTLGEAPPVPPAAIVAQITADLGLTPS